MNKKLFRPLANIVWIVCFLIFGLTVYVNWYLPHSTKLIDTGIESCPDNSVDCAEQYQEDMRKLNIPDWAKFLRRNGLNLFVGLIILGTCLTAGARNYELNKTA